MRRRTIIHYHQLFYAIYLTSLYLITYTMNVDPQNIWLFSAIDKLISENKKEPVTVINLFEKKELMLQLLPTKKIDAHKYKTIVAKAYKEDTGIVKACAEEDIHKLKDPKDEKSVEAWFREMIENTGTPYENQKKLYQYYKSQLAPPPPAVQPSQASKHIQPIQPKPPAPEQKKPEPKPMPKPVEVSQPEVKPGDGIDELVSFKSLDSLLDEYEGPSEKYEKMLARKRKLLDLVGRKELTAEKYKATLELYCKRLSGTDISNDYKFELEGINDFHEGNVQSWFTQTLDETKFSLEMQTDKLSTLKKGPAKSKLPSNSGKGYRESIRESVRAHPKAMESKGFDIGEMNSFRIFDEEMEKQLDNKDNYKALLEKKKKFLDLAKKGTLTGQKYKSLLMKSISEAKNEDIKESMEFELSELGQFHENNVSAWWQDILSNADLMIEDQEKTHEELVKGKKIKLKTDLQEDAAMMKFLNGEEDSDEINISDEDEIKPAPKSEAKKQLPKPAVKKEEPPSAQSPSKGGSDCSNIFSLKALDEFMTENEKNPEKFCAFFQRKQAIFGMMQKGEIDAKKYKILQEKGLATASNEKLKECIQMDLFDLKDMCSGDVDQWFKSLIEDSGLNYDDQNELYNKLKTKGVSAQSEKGESPQSQSRGSLEVKENPNMAQVVCFTAVSKLFKNSIKMADILYYKELCDKRQKLMDLVNQNRLIPEKYREINKKAASKTQNVFLRACIQEELLMLQAKFKGNETEWFFELKKYLFAEPPELKMPENPEMKKINGLPTRQKIEFLARKMVPYESLLSYYRTNQITEENSALLTYSKSKKEVFKAISLLPKNPTFDVYNLAIKLFPDITAQVFYGGNLPVLKKKAQASAGYLVQEISAIKEYSGKIKKATNPNNLENSKKEIAECEATIAALKTWPGKELVPFPVITQQKVQKYNLDLNTHLNINDVEIKISYIQGLQSESYLRIYAGQDKKERFWVKVRDGAQKDAKTIIKLTPKETVDLVRGDRPVIVARLFEKSFWGNFNLIGECPLLGTFIRNNVAEEKAFDGRHTLNYEMRVYKPTKPLVTQIMHTTVKFLPAFKPDFSIEKQILKECLAQLSE